VLDKICDDKKDYFVYIFSTRAQIYICPFLFCLQKMAHQNITKSMFLS